MDKNYYILSHANTNIEVPINLITDYLVQNDACYLLQDLIEDQNKKLNDVQTINKKPVVSLPLVLAVVILTCHVRKVQ